MLQFMGSQRVPVQFSRSVVSNSLRPHGLQHARLPCPSPTSCILSLMSIESVMSSNHLILCHPLLLLPSISPSIRVFSNESVLHLSGQSFGVSASASVPPMDIQDWFPLRYTGWISLQSKGLSRAFSSSTDHMDHSRVFCGWEDASVGTHLIHSFHAPLSCLGPNPAS